MRVGKYEVLGEIGRGGLATVFRVRADGRELALKVLRSTTPASRERFERERRLLASFTLDDGFVPLIDAGDHAGTPFVVMPFLPGGTLRDRLNRGALPVEEVARLAEELAGALARAHARDVVHRDLKPENVLFSASGTPLVADLGLAKTFASDGAATSHTVISRTGELLGTVGYMAPEQARDAKTAGPAADVFALGAIFWECLAGRPAYEGMSLLDVLAKVEHETPPPVTNARPETPPWLASVVGRALAHDPGARFADGGELLEALRARRIVRTPKRGRTVALVALVAGLVAIALGLVVTRRDAAALPKRRDAPSAAAPAPVPVLDRSLVATVASASKIGPYVLNALDRAIRWRASNPTGDVSALVSATVELIGRETAGFQATAVQGQAAPILETFVFVIDAEERVERLDPRAASRAAVVALTTDHATAVLMTGEMWTATECPEQLARAVEVLGGAELGATVLRSILALVKEPKRRHALVARLAATLPGSATIHYNLAASAGDEDEALTEFERAASCPEDSAFERFRAVFLAAVIRSRRGQLSPAAALERLDTVWSRRPPEARYVEFRAYLLLQLQRSEEAARILEAEATVYEEWAARGGPEASGQRSEASILRGFAVAAHSIDPAEQARLRATLENLDYK